MGVIDTQVAYILHKRAYRETSSILEVLTKDFGRVSLMARGSRGARSKIAGNLLLFTPLVISWQGKGNLPYLKSAERADLKAPVLKKKSLLSAMYINELLMYLLHRDDVHEAVFEHYHHCLYCLEDESRLEIALRKFEIKLLELLGFGLNVLVEADTGKAIKTDAQYLYHLEHGPVLYRDSGSKQNASSKLQISGGCLLALANESYQALSENSQYLAELKRLMRSVINFHLGNKKLKSRELFRPVGKGILQG
ncbi:MAG: DNA repair protein RecO [Gammaproteobacteria bacterium]|nr:DNA repair protein RecO [Gammaproteobacteria bacterium]